MQMVRSGRAISSLVAVLVFGWPACGGAIAPSDDAGRETDSGSGSSSGMDSESSGGADSGSSSGADSGSSSGVDSDSSSGADSGPSSGLDSGGASDGAPDSDAPFDSVCGNLNTTTNCGACGLACAVPGPQELSAACCSAGICPGTVNGANDICQYACASGYLDCNSSVPPNTDGCECHVPGASAAQCCGTECPVGHTDGLVGQAYYPPNPNFYDCVAVGTMNSQLAQDACNNYVTARGGGPTDCIAFAGSSDATAPDAWCSAQTPTTGFLGDCICWSFSGTFSGQVLDPQARGLSPAAECWSVASPSMFH